MYRSCFRSFQTIIPFALLLGACSPDSLTAPALDPQLSREGASTNRTLRVAVCPTSRSHRTEGTIGPRGGTLHVAGHRLTIPAGVLSEPTHFTMLAPAGRVVKLELSANGAEHYNFSAPVVVTISYDRCRRQHPLAPASAWYVDETSMEPVERMTGKDDRKRKAVTFRTTHFSTYVVAY